MPKVLTKRGRRPGTSTTRESICGHAAVAFARRGFDGTTVREIARLAGVDTALVFHYFGTKRALFEAAFAIEEASTVNEALPKRAERQVPICGETLVRAFLGRWDSPGGRAALVSLLRSANTDAAALARLTDLVARTIVAPTATQIDPRRSMSRLRANLIAAQLIGLAWARYVLALEPIASASIQLVVKTFAPSVDATLRGRDFGPHPQSRAPQSAL